MLLWCKYMHVTFSERAKQKVYIFCAVVAYVKYAVSHTLSKSKLLTYSKLAVLQHFTASNVYTNHRTRADTIYKRLICCVLKKKKKTELLAFT